MYTLFDAATVVTGDGEWTRGYDIEVIRSSAVLSVTDWCTVSPQKVAGPGVASGAVPIYRINAFAAEISAKRPVRCTPAEQAQILKDLIAEQTERAVAYVLWNGIPGSALWDSSAPYILNTDVATVSAGAADTDSVAAAYAQYSKGVVNFNESILHLGLSAAIKIQGLIELGKVRATGGKFVISESYPTEGIAITGPIKIHLGSTEQIDVVDVTNNREWFRGNRFAAIEFEPSVAVRVN